jgi:transposase InsO family protein
MRIEPRLIIKTLKLNNYGVSIVAKLLEVHRSTVYRWIERAGSPYGYNTYLRVNKLKRKSTKPHTIHLALTGKEIADIMALRKEKALDSRKIKVLLGIKASYNSVQRIITKLGLSRGTNYHRRPKLQPTIHMHKGNTDTIGYLQMDVKYITPELSGLPWTCFEYAVIDIFSRYKEAVILNQLDQDGSMVALMEILPKLPFKVLFIQTDNGLEFQGRFDNYLSEIKLKHHFIHKRTPNENAIIERSFRTDEEEFFYYMKRAPKHYDELREWFAEYLHKYNTWRPHLGINLKRPMDVVAEVLSH